MKPLRFAATIVLLFVTTFTMAQRARMIEGNLNALKGVKKLNVKYDYSNMTVGKKTEKEYVDDKKESYNRKETGRGDKWAKEWIADRANRFEPRFEEEFNNNCEIRIGNFPGEKYTMIFKTVFTEPGFNIGVARKNAYVDGEVWIIETANPGKVIAKLDIPDCPGRTAFGTDFDNGLRLQEAYAMAGKGLARFFGKNID